MTDKTKAASDKKKTSAKKSDDKKKSASAASVDEKKQQETTAAENSGAAASLPLFYNSVLPLTNEQHSKLKLSPAKDLAFAKNASSIVLAAAEFAEAAMHYPIVFGKDDGGNITAYAVTGYASGENIFVDEQSKWREGCYIPAYVRRYPFILMEAANQQSLSLAMDPSSDMLSEEGGVALYEDGKASNAAQNALKFCVSYRNELQKSSKLFKQIDDSGILVDRSAEFTIGGDKKATVTGFSIVDEKLFNALDDETILEMRKSGVLTLIYCHLWSMRVWNNLLA